MNSFIFIIAAVAIAIALIGVLLIWSKRKVNPENKDSVPTERNIQASPELLPAEYVQGDKIAIPIERLPETTAIDEKNLFEITDPTVVARISQTIPAAVETAAKTITNKALKNVELYQAIIPSGATLAKSTQMDDAVRGIYRGTNGINGHANLVKVDPTKISKASVVATGAAAAMNVTSLVVGQYYMSEINLKIQTLSKSISKINDFQEREFKSRILSLIALASEISNFSSEIMESGELRNRKLQTLDDLKREGVQLLQQVNLSIDEIIKENQQLAYKEYQEKVDGFTLLLEYQQVLMTILEEISKLTYLMGKGENSNEMSYSVFNVYLKQSNQIRAALEEWHQMQEQLLGIDIDRNRRSKTGVESFFATIPALINDKWHYKELEDGIGLKICEQKGKSQLPIKKPVDVYDKDISIIIKEGKYYYLREPSDT